MNSANHLPTRHARWAVVAIPVGVLSLMAGATGCARRPIIVQAPPATVIQSPAPSTTTVNTLPPAGREVIVVKEAPPPARAESPPPAPSGDYTWVPGYWAGRESSRTPEWVPGHYEMPPRSGATWVPARWERRSEGYVYVEGYWR